MTRHASVLDALAPVPTISLHPDDAQRLGAVHGSALRVESRHGAIEGVAERDAGREPWPPVRALRLLGGGGQQADRLGARRFRENSRFQSHGGARFRAAGLGSRDRGRGAPGAYS